MKYIRSEQGFSLWKIYHDDTNTYEAAIVSFDKPSVYGINNGKISKLYIKRLDNNKTVCSYNRGLDAQLKEEVKVFYNEIIKELN